MTPPFKVIPANCIAKRIISMNSYGANADKDGKKFEDLIAQILRNGGKTEEEKCIAKFLYDVCGVCADDVIRASASSRRIDHTASKSKIKTDVIIDTKTGRYVSLSLKNTKAKSVGVLETSLDSLFEGLKIKDKGVKSAFILFRDECRFRPSQLKSVYPCEYIIIRDYLTTNIKRVMEGLICGFSARGRSKPDFILFYDKKYQEMACISVNDYIDYVVKNHVRQFDTPLQITRASGHKSSAPHIKFKTVNPIKDIHVRKKN